VLSALYSVPNIIQKGTQEAAGRRSERKKKEKKRSNPAKPNDFGDSDLLSFIVHQYRLDTVENRIRVLGPKIHRR